MKTILVDAVDCFVSNKGEVNQANMLERYENNYCNQCARIS